MSDTRLDNRDIEFNKGFNKDIDWDKNGFNNDKRNQNVSHQGINCGSVMGFISSLQEISVQENLLVGNLDKNLFTLQKTICGIKNGMSLGTLTSITIILHVIFCYVFSYKQVIDTFQDNIFLEVIIKYLPAIATVMITIYISNLSKYAVGDYTARALKTFYTGKLVSTMVIGFLIFVSFVYIEVLLSKISYYPSMQYAMHVFMSDIKSIFFETIMLVLISAFLPFLFYGFRKILFSSSQKSEYEKY